MGDPTPVLSLNEPLVFLAAAPELWKRSEAACLVPEKGAGQFENGQCRRVVKLQGHHNEGESRKGCKEHEKFLKCCQVFPGTGWGRGGTNILRTEPLKRLALEGATRRRRSPQPAAAIHWVKPSGKRKLLEKSIGSLLVCR